MTGELLPVKCRRCGRIPRISRKIYWRIICGNDDCWIGPNCKTERAAITTWNLLMAREPFPPQGENGLRREV